MVLLRLDPIINNISRSVSAFVFMISLNMKGFVVFIEYQWGYEGPIMIFFNQERLAARRRLLSQKTTSARSVDNDCTKIIHAMTVHESLSLTARSPMLLQSYHDAEK